MGAKLPLNYFDTHLDIAFFLENNLLDRILFKIKLPLKYDLVNGLLLPVEVQKDSISWFSWDNLIWENTEDGFVVKNNNVILFHTDKDKFLTNEYSCLMNGIVKYDAFASADFRPFMKLNQKSSSNKYFLDILTNWSKTKNPSYIRKTHVFIELTDENGYVRSVGQDIFIHIQSLPSLHFLRASSSAKILTTPDQASFIYSHLERITKKIRIQITKKEHDKIVRLVESDKYNNQRTAELLKGNCTSYVSRILKIGLNYIVDVDVFVIELLGREITPHSLNKSFIWLSRKLKKQPKWVQIAIFCFPPIYFIYFLKGIFILLSSSSGFKNHRENSVLDLLFKPWKLRCDLPRVMHEILNGYTDENGEIQREKYPPGFIFD